MTIHFTGVKRLMSSAKNIIIIFSLMNFANILLETISFHHECFYPYVLLKDKQLLLVHRVFLLVVVNH